MQGKITDADRDSLSGVITGDDGVRYRFGAPDWCESRVPVIGLKVDFMADDEWARNVRHANRQPGVLSGTRMKGIITDHGISEVKPFSEVYSEVFVIWAEDGKYYTYRFDERDWIDDIPPSEGMTVDFIARGNHARQARRIVVQGDVFPRIRKREGFLSRCLVPGCVLPVGAAVTALIATVGLVVLLVT